MKSWKEFLEKESRETYFIQLMDKVNKAYERERVYPSKEEMFSCFELCPYENVKVVIIGQDPYHGAGQAHGLSFSVKPGVKVPPSLKNIYKELQSDLNIETPNHGYLVSWAKQGVLMLNTSLTVTEGKPGSHKSFGWSKFTQHVLEFLNDYDKPLVFILWGNHAIEAAKGITNPKHFLIKSPHPSPLAGGGFFGTKPFSKTNEFLQKTGRGAIDWRIETVAEEPIGHNDKAEQDVVATTPNQWPSKFKTVWNNIKEVDTTNDVIISEYQGSPLKIIDLNGKQVLVVKYLNKLKFLDPYTFKIVDKTIILAPTTNVWDVNLVKINMDWHAVYVICKDNREADDRYCIMNYNFTNKKTTILETTNIYINTIDVFEINGFNYLFFRICLKKSTHVDKGLIIKYNLHTQQEELRFEISKSSNINFYNFINNNKLILSIVCPYLDHDEIELFDANTGKQLGCGITLTEVIQTSIVEVSDSKYVLVAVTEANHLHLFDTVTGKQTHDILIDDDPNFTITVFNTLAIYKSKLIITSEDRCKVYDLAHPQQEPNLLIQTNGAPAQTENKIFVITYQNKPKVIFPQDYKTNLAQCFSLETYTEETDIKVIPGMSKFLPLMDLQNRELFIIEYRNQYNGGLCSALYNPKGRIRSKEEYEFNYYAVTTDLNGVPVVVTRSNNNIFNLFNIETGQKIKCLKIEGSETKVKPILVTEVKGKQVLLASFSEDIKMFTFPEMKLSNITFPIEAASSMDVIEMDGVKQLIAANDEIFTWNLETGEPIHNPFHVIIEPDAEEEEERYLCSDGFSIHTLNWGDKDSLFIGTVSSDAYIWNPHKPN